MKTMAIQTLTPEEVDVKLLNARGPVILDFYQAACPPCRALEPRLARIAQEYPHRVAVYRFDIEPDTAVADRFQVKSLPTVLILQDGRETQRLDGLITDDQLRTAFEQSSRAHERDPSRE